MCRTGIDDDGTMLICDGFMTGASGRNIYFSRLKAA
jgi:hypothetical protein